jgi:hypothetical protein
LSEELYEVGNVGVSAGAEGFFDLLHNGTEFSAALRIEFGDVISVFGNDVIGGIIPVEGDLVEAGAVVEITEADEADFLKGGEAAVDGDEVASGVREIVVKLFDAGRSRAFQQRFENRHAWLGDAKAGGLEPGAGHVDRRRRFGG